MKTNKGFAPIALVLILLAVIVVGGVAYYAAKNSNPASQNTAVNNSQTQTNQNNNPTINSRQKQQAGCTSTSQPSITVLSPNGGETYTPGQQITVTWNSCNVNKTVGVTLSGFPYPSSTEFFLGDWNSGNTGTRTLIIPKTAQDGKYTLNISTPPESSPSAYDWSDNYFTINKNTDSVSRIINPALNPPVACTAKTTPSITVTNPGVDAMYSVGQKVDITWTSCNVKNVSIGLASGGKDFGEITYPNPIPASQGTYQWTVTNPAKDFTQLTTNIYQIVIFSQTPEVMVRSNTFSVQ